MRFLLPLGIASLLSISCLGADPVAAKPMTKLEIVGATPETFFGSRDNLQMVKDSKSITVFRVIDSQCNPEARDLQDTHGYKCGASVTVTGREVEKAVAALSDVKNFGIEYMCDFDPGVILRIASGKRTLDLIVCFRCGEMEIYRGSGLIRRPYKYAESMSSLGHNAREAFTTISKKAFPKDAKIQALK